MHNLVVGCYGRNVLTAALTDDEVLKPPNV
jgi:hypothetical protein